MDVDLMMEDQTHYSSFPGSTIAAKVDFGAIKIRNLLVHKKITWPDPDSPIPSFCLFTCLVLPFL